MFRIKQVILIIASVMIGWFTTYASIIFLRLFDLEETIIWLFENEADKLLLAIFSPLVFYFLLSAQFIDKWLHRERIIEKNI